MNTVKVASTKAVERVVSPKSAREIPRSLPQTSCGGLAGFDI
jgi:hypothetical protein